MAALFQGRNTPRSLWLTFRGENAPFLLLQEGWISSWPRGTMLWERRLHQAGRRCRKGGFPHARAHMPPETPSSVIFKPTQLFASPTA